MSSEEDQTEIIDLSIPIYLDQKIVFDLLAVFEDGFSQIYSYKKSDADSSEKEKTWVCKEEQTFLN